MAYKTSLIYIYIYTHIYIYIYIERESDMRSWFRIPPGHGCLSVVSVECCQVEVSATS